MVSWKTEFNVLASACGVIHIPIDIHRHFNVYKISIRHRRRLRDVETTSYVYRVFVETFRIHDSHYPKTRSILNQMLKRQNNNNPVDTGCKLNVHKTFRRRPWRLLNVLCTFNLRLVSMGKYYMRFSSSQKSGKRMENCLKSGTFFQFIL